MAAEQKPWYEGIQGDSPEQNQWYSDIPKQQQEAPAEEESPGFLDYAKEAALGVGRGLTGLVDIGNMVGGGNYERIMAEADPNYKKPEGSFADMLGMPQRGEYAGDGALSRFVGLASEFSAPGGALSKGAQKGKAIMQGLKAAVPATGLGMLGESLFGESGRVVGEVIGSMFVGTPRKIAKKIDDSEVKNALLNAAPDRENIKLAQANLYKQIDELGGFYKAEDTSNFVKQVKDVAYKNGITKENHPQAFGVLKRILDSDGKNITTTHLNSIRETAGAATQAENLSDKRMASVFLDQIDMFERDATAINQTTGKSLPQLRKLQQDARTLSSRVILERNIARSMENATYKQGNFENNLRKEFSAMLQNDKFRKKLTQDELKAMKDIAVGSSDAENIVHSLGRLGFDSKDAGSVIRTVIGARIGKSWFGTAGQLGVPVVGKIAQQVTENIAGNNARLVKALALSGDDAVDITKGWLKATKGKERDYNQLSALLAKPGVKNKEKITKIEGGKEIKSILSNAKFMLPYMAQKWQTALNREEEE
jgi:hypothetical protein